MASSSAFWAPFIKVAQASEPSSIFTGISLKFPKGTDTTLSSQLRNLKYSPVLGSRLWRELYLARIKAWISDGNFKVRMRSIRLTPVSVIVGRFSRAFKSSSCLSSFNSLNWSIWVSIVLSSIGAVMSLTNFLTAADSFFMLWR